MIDSWKQMPQFTIIQGDKHTGKTTMVLYMCNKFKLKYVSVKNSVKDVRNVVNQMVEGADVIFHFKDFDKASLQAKNALLKITEEPVAGNYIVITGGPQIKTLESRARKIVMNNYTIDEVIQCMAPTYPEFSTQSLLFDAGINTPSKVEMYSKYESLTALAKFALDISKRITFITDDDCISLISAFDIRYDGVDASHLFLDMLIHILEHNIKDKAMYHYYDILIVLIAAKERLEKDYTLNRKFILYRAFNTIKNLGDNK
jgi:hypothetical protein